MLDTAEFPADETEAVSCQECGKDDLPEMESWFSELATCGRFIGESGYYCDDCYPRCHCQACA